MDGGLASHLFYLINSPPIMTAKHSTLALLLFATANLSLAQSVPGTPVAGLAPYERPANAPRITAPPPLDKARALHGVSEPMPASLNFIEHQGGWFTPFTHSGMTPPYDLRGWHTKPAPSAK